MFAGVRSCYDEGKRTAETLAMDYHRGELVNVFFLKLFYKFVSIFHSQYLQLCCRPLILPVTCYLHGPEAHSCHFQHVAVEGLWICTGVLLLLKMFFSFFLQLFFTLFFRVDFTFPLFTDMSSDLKSLSIVFSFLFNCKYGQVLGTYDDVFNSICSKFLPCCSLDKLCCPRWEHLFHVHSGAHLYPDGSPIKFLNVKSILQSYVCRFALPVFSTLMALECALMMAVLWATLWPRCALSNLRSAFWTLVVQNETATWKRAAVFNLWRSEQASNFVSLIGTSQGTNDYLWWWKSNSELPICLRFGKFLHTVPLNSSETNRDSTQQKNLQLCLKVPSSWIVTKHVGLFWQILQHEILGLCSEQEASWSSSNPWSFGL